MQPKNFLLFAAQSVLKLYVFSVFISRPATRGLFSKNNHLLSESFLKSPFLAKSCEKFSINVHLVFIWDSFGIRFPVRKQKKPNDFRYLRQKSGQLTKREFRQKFF
jgi:hypothetical protein